jgi:flagellar biosynthetic protein FliR
MMEILQNLSGTAQQEFIILFAIFARVGAITSLVPGFGEQVIPARIKLVAALAFVVLIAPMVRSELIDEISNHSMIYIILSETCVGLAIGIFLRLIVIVLQITGAIAAQSTSLSQIFGAGFGAEPQSAFATLLFIGGLALAATLGLHVYLVQMMVWSYEVMPAFDVLDPSKIAQWGISHISQVFALSFSFAAPFVIASVIYNIGLGVINRAMPQLMVAMVGAPAISLGGLILLLVASPYILSNWVQFFFDSMDFEVSGLR